MRIRKNITLGIIGWSTTKFAELTLQELYGLQQGELRIYLRVKGLTENSE